MTPQQDINIRHELRTPIKIILGFCEALLNPSQFLPASYRSDVEAIYRNAQQLATLIDTVTINAPRITKGPIESGESQLVVLDSGGAVYELLREYMSSYKLIRVASAEEIGRLGQDVNPIAVVNGTGDDRLVPLLTQLIGLKIPILTVSFQTPRSQLDNLRKPVQFHELEAVLQRMEAFPHTVLIVDDNRDNIELLGRMLLSMPQPPRLFKAFTGHEALALLAEQIPDLILTDFVLPDMDGVALRDFLSVDTRLAHVPIVFVSAHHLPDILGLSGASKLTLFEMTATSPVRVAQQIQGLLDTFTSDQ